jgi:hypothetical protein|tara:strand:- start:3366 stop:3887 length:522 start_codon:yes stop_codon:yes gene_type:complete
MFTKFTRLEQLTMLTLEEAKNQLNIVDFNDDDIYITSLIHVASELCEKATNRKYSKCLFTGQFVAKEVSLYLPYSPIISIISVMAGNEVVTYDFNEYSEILTITDKTVDPYANITVTFEAGYLQGSTPHIVKQSCKIIVADLYANRESIIGEKMTEIPMSALSLLNTIKIETI